MDYDEFNALTAACEGILKQKNPGARISAGKDAFAIHGRQGAQVALLQSPILPAVSSVYLKKENFPGLPVDKPHTRTFLSAASPARSTILIASRSQLSRTLLRTGMSALRCAFVIASRRTLCYKYGNIYARDGKA